MNGLNSQDMLMRIGRMPLVTKLHLWLRLFSFPFASVLPFVPNDGVVYDVGCGFGIFSFLLAKDSIKRRIVAYDPSPEKTAVAHMMLQGLDNVTVYHPTYQPTERLPHLGFRPKAAVLIDVLYLLSPQKKRLLLRSIFSLLQPKGKVIVAIVPKEPSWRYVLSFLQEFLMVRCLRWTASKMQVINFESEEFLHRLLSQCGFSFITHHRLPTPFPFFHRHVLFVAEKP